MFEGTKLTGDESAARAMRPRRRDTWSALDPASQRGLDDQPLPRDLQVGTLMLPPMLILHIFVHAKGTGTARHFAALP
jgi:hypothetical protein